MWQGRLGASIAFFLLFSGAAYYAETYGLFPPEHQGAEGLEKVPVIAFCFLALMMLIATIRGLSKLNCIKDDLEGGEKLCGNAIYKRGILINKIPHVMLDFDKSRTVRVGAPYSRGPVIPKREQVYVELAPGSSVLFKLRHEEIAIID